MEEKNYLLNYNRNYEFIFAGRLDKTKGIDRLLEAWKILTDTQSFPPTLLICGTGPEKQFCMDYISANKLQDTIKMLGHVKNSQVVTLIEKSLALILPTQWYEGFPMTVVEAFGTGTPVLGSDIGNVGSLVRNGITGYTFNQESPESIVEAVMKLLVVREESIDIYKSTYEFYNSHFTVKKNYSVLSGIYDKISR